MTDDEPPPAPTGALEDINDTLGEISAHLKRIADELQHHNNQMRALIGQDAYSTGGRHFLRVLNIEDE